MAKEKLTNVEYLQIGGARTHVAPRSLYWYASEYANAASSLPCAEGFSPVPYALACHSIELALKSFLSLKGVDLDTLSSARYGHKLAELVSEAETAGLSGVVAFTMIEREQIVTASIYHNEKVFAYPAFHEAATGYKQRPDLMILLSVADKLVAQLREQVLSADLTSGSALFVED